MPVSDNFMEIATSFSAKLPVLRFGSPRWHIFTGIKGSLESDFGRLFRQTPGLTPQKQELSGCSRLQDFKISGAELNFRHGR